MNINFNNINNILKSAVPADAGPVKNPQELAVQNNLNQNRQELPQLNSELNIKFNNLNRLQQAMLLKEILNLPKEWNELMSLIVYKEISPENLLKLLQENQKGVTPEEIKKLLETNSRETLNKLLKFAQPAQGNWHNFDQVKDIMALVNQIAPNQTKQPEQILKDIILTYLPWFPLAQQQDIQLSFEIGQSGSDDEEASLVIYITTINLGKFKAVLGIKSDNSVDIDIENDLPDSEDKTVTEEILKRINNDMSENKIPAKTGICVTKPTSAPKFEQREVSIHPTSKISPVIMMAAHTIIKIIFEFDEKFSLLKTRQEMLG